VVSTLGHNARDWTREVDVSHLVAFAVVAILAVMTPGPDFAIVTRTSLVGGRRAGVLATLGIGTGLLVHASAAAAGLSVVIATSAAAFTVVKLAGAVYLLVLGVQALRAALRRRRDPHPDAAAAAADAADAAPAATGTPGSGRGSSGSSRGFYLQGLLTNVLNPKAVLFFLSLMPQFIPAGGSVVAWTMLLTAILVVAAMSWFALVAVLVVQLRGVLTRPRVARAVEGTTGAVFIGLAGRLALERP
jgi:threonine/homoserine/homoserine lactone efflux protein